MHQIIGIALVLTLAVMPVLAATPTQTNPIGFGGTTIVTPSVSTNPSSASEYAPGHGGTPPGQGGTPPGQAKQAEPADDDDDPTGVLGASSQDE
jgi:hypothetical protein